MKLGNDMARRLVALADELTEDLHPEDDTFREVDAMHLKMMDAYGKLMHRDHADAAAVAAQVIAAAVEFRHRKLAAK